MYSNNPFSSKKWIKDHARIKFNEAGPRYTAELNVELPLSLVFSALSRDAHFYQSAVASFVPIEDEFGSILSIQLPDELKSLRADFSAMAKAYIQLSAQFAQFKKYSTDIIDWGQIEKLAIVLRELCQKVRDGLQTDQDNDEENKKVNPIVRQPGDPVSKKHEWQLSTLLTIISKLYPLTEINSKSYSKASNSQFLLITGEAGSGKTHLVCDLICERGKKNLPTVLLFGDKFSGSGVFPSVRSQLRLPDSYHTLLDVLRRLDAAGQKRKVRALIIIDALNESPLGYWKTHLKKLVKVVGRFENLALIVTVRDGFTQEVLQTRIKKIFHQERHTGFALREWDAVVKYFGHYGIPLPEIPLLLPEFQNPLFLRLFCLGARKRSDENQQRKAYRQAFRGREGATYIFETFIKNASEKIIASHNLPRDLVAEKQIWDFVIKKAAEGMVAHSRNYILHGELDRIVASLPVRVDTVSFIKDLDRALLLVRVPRYSRTYKVIGYKYQFPFQKFSDHLIVRYLLAPKPAASDFLPDGFIGRMISSIGSYGIIEALSIQVPERYNGKELYELATQLHDDYSIKRSIIQSIIWRNPKSFSLDKHGFPLKLASYLNKSIITEGGLYQDFLRALITVAPIDTHPFNARLLHRYLFKFSLGSRDHSWSSFLHSEQETNGSVDRLLEWANTFPQAHQISKGSLALTGIALGWFLTTPNRAVRDKATKGLVRIFSGRIGVYTQILRAFRGVNDPYVQERLYAVAYAIALRGGGRGLKQLTEHIYQNIFAQGRPPMNVLIRDYARQTIECALSKRIKVRLNKQNVRPPYKSRITIPKFSSISRKKDLPGLSSVWSSVMYSYGSLADFGNYVLDNKINRWYSIPRTRPLPPSEEILRQKFNDALSPYQKRLQKKYESVKQRFFVFGLSSNKRTKVETDAITNNLVKVQSDFNNSLGKKQKRLLALVNGARKSNLRWQNYGYKEAQRWIFGRVLSLGYSHKLHADFDRMITPDYTRSESSSERIGKKYQWIALHEFIGYLADNYHLKSDTEPSRVEKYDGAWQIDCRDIDPTAEILPRMNVLDHNELAARNNWTNLCHVPQKGNMSSWLKRKDLPKPEDVIVAPKNRQRWLVLEGMFDWEEPEKPGRRRYQEHTKRVWYRVKSLVVKSEDLKRVRVSWKSIIKAKRNAIPESHDLRDIFLGEFPSGKAYKYFDKPYYSRNGWVRIGDTKIMAHITCEEYTNDWTRDYSASEKIRIKLPSSLLIRGAKITSPTLDGRYYDGDRLVALDPSAFLKEYPSVLLVEKKFLVKYLAQKRLAIVWVVQGEKIIIGEALKGPHLGRMNIDGVYFFDRQTQIKGRLQLKFDSRR